MTKLDHPKITTIKKPKEPNYDGLLPLEVIGQRSVVVTPKTTEREAKEKQQINQKNLEKMLAFVAAEKFNTILFKEPYIKKIEDLIHELRASPYRSASLSDADSLIIKARAVVKYWRLFLPSQLSSGLWPSLKPKSKGRARKDPRASKRRMS